MTNTDHWTSAPDRTVRGETGLCHPTVAQPPFDVDARELPAQDPAAPLPRRATGRTRTAASPTPAATPPSAS
ncbi:hypothetical protein [Streptomyces californicus]|uniref:hypothetical protein n=1 Tax=Streptomyces californicus TaxID=67351 RepID=UPI0037BB96CF